MGTFRLRIWRGKAGPAVVLASQLIGGPSPSWSSSQLANLAFRVYLGFSPAGMLNFEDETIVNERALFALSFKPLGHLDRRYLPQPVRRLFRRCCLEDIVGEPVARQPHQWSTQSKSFLNWRPR
jgi:hypothetical protein